MLVVGRRLPRETETNELVGEIITRKNPFDSDYYR